MDLWERLLLWGPLSWISEREERRVEWVYCDVDAAPRVGSRPVCLSTGKLETVLKSC